MGRVHFGGTSRPAPAPLAQPLGEAQPIAKRQSLAACMRELHRDEARRHALVAQLGKGDSLAMHCRAKRSSGGVFRGEAREQFG